MSKLLSVFFVISLLYASNCLTISKRSGIPDRVFDGAKLSALCMKTMMDQMEPEFCWKSGGDAGFIPFGCPPGFFRSLTLCFQECAPGYTHVMGICWAGCPSGYADHGMSCYADFLNWYFKHSYIPLSITNFDQNVPCPKGTYKQGALCYRDCRNHLMENCGIGACSASSESCTQSIISLVADVFQGLVDAFTTIVSFGSVAALKTSLKSALDKLGKETLKKMITSLKSSLTKRGMRELVFQRGLPAFKQLVKDKAKELGAGSLQDNFVINFCATVWKTSVERVMSTNDIMDTGKLTDALDLFNSKGIMTSCKDVGDVNTGIDCAANVISGLSTFDPSGLLVIAAALLKPVCDENMPEGWQLPPIDKVNDYNKFLAFLRDDCITIHDRCDYGGLGMKYCGNDRKFQSNLVSFSGRASSMKTGAQAHGLFFSQKDYRGEMFPFAPGQTIPCFEKLQKEFKISISSIRFYDDLCVIISLLKHQDVSSNARYNNFFCSNMASSQVGFPAAREIKDMKVHMYKQNMKLLLFASANYKNCVEFKQTGNIDFTQLKSNIWRSWKINY